MFCKYKSEKYSSILTASAGKWIQEQRLGQTTKRSRHIKMQNSLEIEGFFCLNEVFF